MDTFGFRLKKARKAKGMTQRELADAVGAKHNSISNWENDQNKPDPDIIELICGALDIEPNDLLKKSATENFSEYAETLNKTHSLLMIDSIERKIICNYRKADEIDKSIVLRTLRIDQTIYNSVKKKKEKYIPTEEDIQSLVARNGKKFTREEAIAFISDMLSDDEEE